MGTKTTSSPTLRIIVDDLSGPEIGEFLESHVEETRAVSPPESKHALDLDALRSADVTLWSVFADTQLVGCGGIKQHDPAHGEIKSMRTAPEMQGRGIGSTLLRHMIGEARHRGYRRLSVETGSYEFFAPARALYLKHGFSFCEPFAEYKPDPNSVFMTKVLEP